MGDHPHPLQYDSIAAAYLGHAAEAPYNALYDRPAVLDLLGDVAGKVVLDAGCGPGLYAEELVRRGAARLIGCDASPEMVALARERVGDAADLRVHDLGSPFTWLDDESVDLAMMALVIHHLTDRVAVLGELHRVLRGDGALVISTHHPTADWMRLGGSYFAVEATTERWSKGWDITAWRMPLTVMSAEFSDAGFLIERLVEPLPAAEMAETHPEYHQRLSTEPAFILFRLVKG